MTDEKAGLNHPKRDDILVLARQGLSYSKIAERLGVSRSYCATMANAAGIRRGGKKHPATVWSDYDRAALVGMFRADLSAEMIAKRFGVTRWSVVTELRRLKLKRWPGQTVISTDGARRRF
jgi:transposase